MEQDFMNSLNLFFKTMINEAVNSAVDRILSQMKEEQKTTEATTTVHDELLTAKEVCSRLHISAPTLWRLQKTGKIHPLTEKGQKRFYRYSEVEQFFS